MSRNFGFVDVDHLTFPTKMSVDWIRVYQDPDRRNIGCDPEDFPTAAYIDEYVCARFECRVLYSCDAPTDISRVMLTLI